MPAWASGAWADGAWAGTAWADAGVIVPDVVGQSQASGTSELEGEGFVVAVQTAYSSTVPVGDIISQSPIAGIEYPGGGTVTITVSLGEAPAADIQSSGGWYLDWRDVQEMRRRRKKRREERERELAELAEEVAEGNLTQADGEIAELLRVQEAKDDARKERERLRQLADSAKAAALSERVMAAAEKAAAEATRKNLDRFERELKRYLEDEEIMALAALLLADD